MAGPKAPPKLKLAVEKDSLHGQRIQLCLDYGLPLNILEVFGQAATRVAFTSHEAKRAYFILKAAFMFTAGERSQIALFQRLPAANTGQPRLTSGTSLFCGLTPDAGFATSFEAQISSKVTVNRIREVRLLGQGVSVKQNITYLLTALETVLDRRQALVMRDSRDHFIGFAPLATAHEQLGDAPLEHQVLAYLRGEPHDPRAFIPSAVDTAAQEVHVAGLDIHRFSKLPNAQQVLKYVTLQVLVRHTLDDLELTAHMIQTGDGAFVVFPRSRPEQVLGFCLALDGRLALLNSGIEDKDLWLRYAVHRGPVYRVHDFNHQVNFIGDGMNYCARLLNFKEPGVIQVSAEFRRSLRSRSSPLEFEAARLDVKHQPEPDVVYRCDLGSRRRAGMRRPGLI